MTPRRKRSETLTLSVCVFEEKHISLLLLPPSLFFLPADLHSRWVGLLLFASSFFSRLLFLSSSSREGREKFNPERALFPFFVTRNCAARKNQGNGAHLLSTLLLSLSLSVSSHSLCDRATIAAPTLTQLALHNDNNGEIKAIKITRDSQKGTASDESAVTLASRSSDSS